MTTITRLRLGALAASFAAVAAFGAPSAALAGKSHHTGVYKVEKHVELEGEDSDYTLSCKSTDIAIDGMWRIDNVDQDNDWEDPDPALAAFWGPAGIGTHPDLTVRKAIRPIAAHADSTDHGLYHFAFTPLAGADVDLKLWVTCLPDPLEGVGHDHDWQFTQLAGQQSTTTVPVAQSSDPGAAAGTIGTCPPRTVLIQPGFATTSTGHHVVTSRPDPSGPTWKHREWRWNVWDDGTAPAPAPALTWRCLDVKSSVASAGTSHRHKLVFNLKETDWDGTGLPVKPQIGAQQFTERQQHCGEHYKGMLGGWDVSGTWRAASVAPAYPDHMSAYYLGMDPRIKSRAFKFLNLDETPETVSTALVCWKDRTT